MGCEDIKIRVANINDLDELQTLFVETIKTVCISDYSDNQIAVWSSFVDNKQRWIDRIESQYFIVAYNENYITGFISLDNNYIDLLYIHKNHQKQGVAKKLYREIELEATKNMVSTLYSNVSITAKPFFEKLGFKTVQKQINIVKGIEIINYRMIKELDI
ncbi:GNAT family N-acetyltransferase [bacterium]|nr:GNAT family N-acetyltransferase [bacterium]